MLGFAQAFRNSMRGFGHVLRSERAVQQEVAVLVVATPLAFFVGATFFQRAILIGGLFGVIAVELLNTCVEKLCDHVTPSLHPQIRAVKDMGSAAVLSAIIGCGLCWAAALAERLGY
jgi:diacylglycerol kinase (ATP)